MINADIIIKQFHDALLKFGTYQLEDKGLSGVMDTHEITTTLKELDGKEAGQILKEVVKKERQYGQQIIDGLFSDCDDASEEWFEEVQLISGAEY